MVKDLIEPIVRNLDKLINECTPGESLCCFRRDHQQPPTVCEFCMLGRAMRQLHQHRLHPMPEPRDILLSPSALAAILSTLADSSTGITGDGAHKHCRAFFKPKKTLTAAAGPSDRLRYAADYRYTVNEAEEAHLSEQASQTGVYIYDTEELLAAGEVPFFV